MIIILVQFLRRYFLELFLFFIAIVFLFILCPGFSFLLGFLVSYLLFVLFINNTFLPRGIAEGLKTIKNKYRYSLLILIFILLSIIWQFNFDSIVFFTILISFILYGWDSRIIAVGALISLALCPVLLIFKQYSYAQNMANYTYYFLAIAVILRIIESWERPELNHEPQNK